MKKYNLIGNKQDERKGKHTLKHSQCDVNLFCKYINGPMRNQFFFSPSFKRYDTETKVMISTRRGKAVKKGITLELSVC